MVLGEISYGNLRYSRPTTGLQAKFSIEYCLARALVDGWLGLEDFSDGAIVQPEVQQLMERIHVEMDRKLDINMTWGSTRPAVITVELNTGDVLKRRADSALGHSGDWSMEMRDRKFRDCLEGADLLGSSDEVKQQVEAFDECRDVAEFMALLRAA